LKCSDTILEKKLFSRNCFKAIKNVGSCVILKV